MFLAADDEQFREGRGRCRREEEEHHEQEARRSRGSHFLDLEMKDRKRQRRGGILELLGTVFME